MKGKINRSVDKCIHLLMKIAKDKALERLIKLEKGKTSYWKGIINNGYVHSIKLSIQAVTETHCNECTVTSTLEPENHYTIKKQQTILVKIAIYDARNVTFVYTSTHVHIPTLFSM